MNPFSASKTSAGRLSINNISFTQPASFTASQLQTCSLPASHLSIQTSQPASHLFIQTIAGHRTSQSPMYPSKHQLVKQTASHLSIQTLPGDPTSQSPIYPSKHQPVTQPASHLSIQKSAGHPTNQPHTKQPINNFHPPNQPRVMLMNIPKI